MKDQICVMANRRLSRFFTFPEIFSQMHQEILLIWLTDLPSDTL
jgi:hypothetical protein